MTTTTTTSKINFVLKIKQSTVDRATGTAGSQPPAFTLTASPSHPRQLLFLLQLCQQALPELVHPGTVNVRTPGFDDGEVKSVSESRARPASVGRRKERGTGVGGERTKAGVE